MDISKVLARGSAKCYVKVDIMLIIPKELAEYVQVNVWHVFLRVHVWVAIRVLPIPIFTSILVWPLVPQGTTLLKLLSV